MPPRPDIVLFLTDQQRFDQLGYASGGHFRTPNLDRIARSGVTFENAYSASTVCVPSRVALMTGIEPHRVPTQENRWALREGFWTIAHGLRQAGYETALIGKAHFAPVHARHGFETLRLCEHLHAQGTGALSRARGDELDDYHYWLLDHGYPDWRFDDGAGAGTPRAANAFPYGPEVHPTGWVEREAAEFLDARDRRRPLFLVVSFPHPHAPYNPPEPYASMFEPADAQLPDGGFGVNDGLPMVCQLALKNARTRDEAADEQRLRRFLATVRGLVAQIDGAVGRLVDRLDLDSTVVAFTSDHGDYAGHRGLMRKIPWMPFDDLARVPMVYAGHGVVGRGRVVSTLVQSYDFAPTALDFAGIEPGVDDVDGRSLRPLLAGRPDVADLERSVFCAIGMGWPMIRRRNHKYFVHAEHGSAVLFDLENDPGERVNLAGDPSCAELERDLRDRLAQRLAKPSLAHADVGIAP